MKQYLMLAMIFLLVAGVVYEEKHRAEPVGKLIDLPGADYPGFQLHPMPPSSHFVDQVDLWANPAESNRADSAAALGSLTFNNNPLPMGSWKIRSRPAPAKTPALTVEDRELQYAVLTSGGLTLTLDFTPTFANPDAWLPSRIDPGIGASFRF